MGNSARFEHKRRFERSPANERLDFIALSCTDSDFQRIKAAGTVIDMSDAGIGMITDFPLEPGHVVEWDDRHRPGNLHIALVKWSMQLENRVRCGLMFI